MDRVHTAWAEDRRQFVLIVVWLVAGGALVAANRGGGALVWLMVMIYAFLVVRQALEVLVYRPRRLARTCSREQQGFWHW